MYKLKSEDARLRQQLKRAEMAREIIIKVRPAILWVGVVRRALLSELVFLKGKTAAYPAEVYHHFSGPTRAQGHAMSKVSGAIGGSIAEPVVVPEVVAFRERFDTGSPLDELKHQ